MLARSNIAISNLFVNYKLMHNFFIEEGMYKMSPTYRDNIHKLCNMIKLTLTYSFLP